MRPLTVLWSLMRYRTMIAVLLFFAVSLLLHHADFSHILPSIILTIFSLIFIHIAGTAWNDWADYQIDQVNLYDHKDRPLVAGTISRTRLIQVAILISCLALISTFVINTTMGIITLILLIANSQYSLRPLHLAYRQWIVPFYLPIGYISAPLAFGFLLGTDSSFHLLPCLGLYALFVARVSLKDFRDRKGDKKFHKPTLILSYGKRVVCSLCASMTCVGSVLLIISTGLHVFSIAAALFCATTLWIIYRLYRESRPLHELLLIGLGARLGNGLVITYLAYLLTLDQPVFTQSVLLTALLCIYGRVVYEHITHPDTFHFGKRAVV